MTTIQHHEMCPEMVKLRTLLDRRHIDWEDESDSPSEYAIYRTHFCYSGDRYSVIYGFGTYGGWNRFFREDPQLLELMINHDEPTGWHTAKDVIQIMQNRSKL